MSEAHIHLANKEKIIQLSQSLYDFEPIQVKKQLTSLFAPQAKVQLCYPFENLAGAEGLYQDALLPLYQSIPDLEKRNTIIMAGATPNGDHWVGCCGYFVGTFCRSWLDIPASKQTVAMRFHEFYRFEAGQVVELQAIWDIPEVMMQARAWPLVPSLGREWHVPGPATLDGIHTQPQDLQQTAKTLQCVGDMCAALGEYASGGVAAMRLSDYWHPNCSWYGPSGIGTSRTLKGFRQNHQIPFLNGLPNRISDLDGGHMFADNNYVGFTAWPGMHMTVSGSGWLGIAPGNQEISMRSLDFWRVEGDLIRENWVLIDLLSVYDQLGVPVFERMRELCH